MRQVVALVHAWLILDFFSQSRRSGDEGSSLTTAIFGQSFLGLLFAVVLLPDPGKCDGSQWVAYAAANLTLSTVLLGMSVLGDPTRMQRLRADEILVRTAPVGRGTLATARMIHGSVSLSLVTIGVALAPAILSYWVAGRLWWAVPFYLLLACVLSGIAAGAFACAAGLATRWLGLARGQLVAASIKALMLGGGFLGFALCLPHLRGVADDLPFGRTGAMAWPPYWAARWLAEPAAAWTFGAALLGLGVVLWLLSSGLQRAPRRTASTATIGWLDRLDRLWVRSGPTYGFVAFVSTMLFRSPGYRAKVLPVLGLPAAMMGLALWNANPEHRTVLLGIAMQFPAIYLPLLVAFLPQADDPKTGWVFATSPQAGAMERVRPAALVSLTTHVLLPAHALAVVVLLCSDVGLVTIAGLTCFTVGLSVFAGSAALRGLLCVPFSDDREGVELDSSMLMGLAFILGIAGGAFALIAGHPLGLALGVAVLWTGLRVLRRGVDD